MITLKSNLWQRDSNPNTVYVATTNAIRNCNNCLVMGRGSALELVKRIPMADALIAITLSEMGYRLNGTEDYGFILFQAPSDGKFGWGIFQTKRHWKDVAHLETIAKSVEMLHFYATNYSHLNFRVPYPAVGCGQIGNGVPPTKKQVDKLLSILPDNVTFYHR